MAECVASVMAAAGTRRVLDVGAGKGYLGQGSLSGFHSLPSDSIYLSRTRFPTKPAYPLIKSGFEVFAFSWCL